MKRSLDLGNRSLAAAGLLSLCFALTTGGAASAQATFVPSTAASLPTTVRCLATADVNIDGLPDLITANSAAITTLLGIGLGQFVQSSSPVGFPGQVTCLTTSTQLFSGLPDVVLIRSLVPLPSTFDVFVPIGIPPSPLYRFAMTGASAITSAPQNVLVADLDGNGNGDVVVTDQTNLYVYSQVLTMAAALPSVLPLPGASHLGLAAADLDGNNIIDLAITAGGINQLVIADNNGLGTLTFSSVGVGANPVGVLAANLDGIGLPELVVATAGAAGCYDHWIGAEPLITDLGVLAGAGPAATDLLLVTTAAGLERVAFDPKQALLQGEPIDGPWNHGAVRLALWTAGSSPPYLAVLDADLHSVHLAFYWLGAVEVLPSLTFAAPIRELAWVDLSGDGIPELAAAGAAGVEVVSLDGNSILQLDAPPDPQSTDLLAALKNAGSPVERLAWIRTDAKGPAVLTVADKFGPTSFLPLAALSPVAMAVADADGDEFPDLCLSLTESGQCAVLLHAPASDSPTPYATDLNGMFVLGEPSGAASNGAGVAFADIDRDGDADIVHSHPAGGAVHVYFGSRVDALGMQLGLATAAPPLTSFGAFGFFLSAALQEAQSLADATGIEVLIWRELADSTIAFEPDAQGMLPLPSPGEWPLDVTLFFPNYPDASAPGRHYIEIRLVRESPGPRAAFTPLQGAVYDLEPTPPGTGLSVGEPNKGVIVDLRPPRFPPLPFPILP